jgi:superfamily II DNA helicase RecQ
MIRSDQHVLAELGIAQFKPLQERAHHMLTDVIAHHRSNAAANDDSSSCLIALPTSSGKDLLAFSVARAFSGTVVVFHPFKALTAAADTYAMQFHCSAAVFASGFSLCCSVDVVVAAYEHAHDGIVQLIQSLHRRGRLVCIFYNEAHVALPHVDGLFRNFGPICELAPILRHACQFPLVFVCCTATLQPQHFKLLAATLCLPPFTSLCRASPIRRNLTISLRVVAQAQLIATLVEIALAAPLRVIVFVPIVKLCSELKDALSAVGRPIFTYHADMEDSVKANTLRDFSSLSSILVTTTALSCGMNVANVSDVVIFGQCFSTEALLQSGGRAARHGDSGRVVFLTSPYYIRKMAHSDRYGSQQVFSLIHAPSFSAALEQLYA